CLSRQRVWGVPIPAFCCARCRNDLLDAGIMEHVAEIFAREGSNAWFSRPAEELLPARTPACSECGSREVEKQHDIVDVWLEPAAFMEKNGAELLRLWTAASDYQGDVVFSKTVLAQLGESYRKIRNTCRFLLSNLYDFVPSRDRREDHELRELDRLAVGVLRERDHQIFDCYKRYSFHEVVRLMNDYAINVSAE